MRIEFASSGGFANLLLNYRVETDQLPKEQAEELLNLVKSSGVFEMTQNEVHPQTSGQPADVISYHLSLADRDTHKSLTFNDVTAPASLRPLLSRLRQLALEQMRKGKESPFI